MNIKLMLTSLGAMVRLLLAPVSFFHTIQIELGLRVALNLEISAGDRSICLWDDAIQATIGSAEPKQISLTRTDVAWIWCR